MKSLSMRIDLEVSNPVPHRTPTVTRWGTYKGKRELAYIEEVTRKIKEQLPSDWERFGEVPLIISITHGFMPAKSWTKAKKKQAFDGKYVAVKPDLDNLTKCFMDCLMVDVITDDRFVVQHKEIKKVYVESPYVEFEIKEYCYAETD